MIAVNSFLNPLQKEMRIFFYILYYLINRKEVKVISEIDNLFYIKQMYFIKKLYCIIHHIKIEKIKMP